MGAWEESRAMGGMGTRAAVRQTGDGRRCEWEGDGREKGDASATGSGNFTGQLQFQTQSATGSGTSLDSFNFKLNFQNIGLI